MRYRSLIPSNNQLFSLAFCWFLQGTRLIDGSSPWKSAPWQANDDSSLEQLRYNDLSPTIFSPTGRLHPVERTMEEVKDLQSNLVVALSCQDGIVMLSTVPLSPHLNTTITPLVDENNQTIGSSLFLIENVVPGDESSNTLPIIDLGPGVWGATAGKQGDSQVLRMRLEAMAQQSVDVDLDDQIVSELSVPKLARKMADFLQVPTQKTNGRQGPLLSSAAVVAGHGQLWRIDPTGQFWSCHGAIVGRESDKAEEEILTRILDRIAEKTNDAGMDIEQYLRSIKCEDALDMICESLQEVFWPSSLNLRLLPPGVRAHIPSIPWVAVRVNHGRRRNESVSARSVWRGAFVPRIPADIEGNDGAPSTSKQEETSMSKDS